MYFSDLSDEQIIEGLRRHDEQITRDYFYGYCRMAYYHFDKAYNLSCREGLDFYSLAHEYYLSLVVKNWEPLINRKPSVRLSTWMVGGFRFVMLDKIKALQSHNIYESLDERLRQGLSCNELSFVEQPVNYGSTIEELCSELDIRAIDRQILIAMLQDGYKSKEIAGMLGITPSAVSQRYHKMLNERIMPYLKRRHFAEPEARVFAEMAMPSRPSATPDSYYMGNITHSTPMSESLKSVLDSDNLSRGEKRAESRAPRRMLHRTPSGIYVFESNLLGIPLSRTAHEAIERHGAEPHTTSGLTGNSYAIPTMQGGIETIAPYVEDFIRFAHDHDDMLFEITNIGAESGFDTYEIAPLFSEASNLTNVRLCDELQRCLL